jgi:hypothetical protein
MARAVGTLQNLDYEGNKYGMINFFGKGFEGQDFLVKHAMLDATAGKDYAALSARTPLKAGKLRGRDWSHEHLKSDTRHSYECYKNGYRIEGD